MEQQQPGMTIEPHKAALPHPETPAQPPAIPHESAPEPPASQLQYKADQSAAPRPIAVSSPNSGAPVSDESISWTSSEFIAHEKSAAWYGILGVAAVVVAVISFLLTHDKVSAVVIIVAAALLGYFATRKPSEQQYKLDESGITIGAKFYDYDFFKSFAVVDEGTVSGIVLMPLQRFMPQLTMYYEDKDEDRILDVLADRLPMEKHQADAVDRLINRIHF